MHRWFLLFGALCAVACESRRPEPGTPLDSVALADAGATATRRFTQHFAEGQGLSIDMVRARAEWFTDSLFALLSADMGDPSGDLGYVEFDPFTAAQDDAASFRLRRVRASADTAYAEFAIMFGSGAGSDRAGSEVSLAMVRSATGWRIADILDEGRSLAAGIRALMTPASRTPTGVE